MARRKQGALNPVWHELYVDRDDNLPPTKQIANAIRHKIATNRVRAGETLPSVRELAHLLGVTPATVARAYAILQEESLLETRRGAETVIANVARIDEAAFQHSLDAVNEVLEQAIQSLRGLGLSAQEIRFAIESKLAELPACRRVLFAAGARVVAEKYTRILEPYLAALGVQLFPVTVADLVHPTPDVTMAVQEAERVITLLSFYRAVREVFKPNKLPVLVLLTEITFSTLAQLEAIPPNHRVLFIAEEAYRTTGTGMLRAYCGGDQLLVARSLNLTELRQAAAQVDTIIHTLGVSTLVKEVIQPGQMIIELQYQPREDAIKRIVAALTPTIAPPRPTLSKESMT